MTDTEKKFNELLSNQTWWDKFAVRFWFFRKNTYSLIPTNIQTLIWILKRRIILWLFGFRVIALYDYAGEDTFIFNTDNEASKASELESKYRLLVGWWYGREEFSVNDTPSLYCRRVWGEKIREDNL